VRGLLRLEVGARLEGCTMRATLVLIGSLLLSPALAGAADAPARRTISVSADGEVTAAPDLAILSFAVETTAHEASKAAADNASKSATVAAAVKKQLGEKDKITTTRYSLEPTYERREPGSPAPPAISGYVSRNEVRVETRRIDEVGQLIDVATRAGANRVSGLEFTLDDRADELREALLKAGREARQQAETVAQALGVTLKQVVSASTSSAPIIMPRDTQRFSMAAAMERSAPTPVEPGEIIVRASLQVTYEIE
jgi:uncharacterized protein